VIDSDWLLLAIEPLGPARTAALQAAARPAYKTPHIGRQLHRLFRHAGFRDVELRVLASPDVKGHMATVVWNMISYARASGQLAPAELDAIEREVRAAIESGDYLLLLPQFLATGVA
jgi:hypothetical protein